MKNLKMATKIFLLCGMIILVFSIFVGWLYFLNKGTLYEGREAKTKHSVETAWSVVNNYLEMAKSGALSTEEAKAQAMAAVKTLRYDNGNYFWINDDSPRMIMHPFKPELDGKDLSKSEDPNGVRLFVEMAKVAKTSGEGFVNYAWPKPGFDKPVPKLSYVKLVPEWNWIIGSGLYIDDVEAASGIIFWKITGLMAAVVVFTLAMIYLVSRGIVVPLRQTGHMLEEMAKGHLEHRLRINRKDEIGEMAMIMDNFADSLQHEVVDALQKLAQGDLTYKVTPVDKDDVVRGSLKKLEEDLNDMMLSIRTAGEQIASGSMEVADSSQSLSQGATEQASSLEQITSSMTQIASQTSLNAQNASQANNLASLASTGAAQGNELMQQMIQAMHDINESGQNISKIIKVIDEIAFQTNLLALNAAVEAARAGQHGKGFAVVAEEVRNLAARSAKAAQETAELIAGSVSKTERGVDIATGTADALVKIVQETTKVSDLVADIAAASNEQAQGISQINVGLSQIDQVTQQNTATAEESAAAAEELSGQANQLKDMLARFRLKGARPSRDIGAAFSSSPPRAIGGSSTAMSWPSARQSNQSSEPQIVLDDSDFGKY